MNLEEAMEEREELMSWLEDFTKRQQEATQIMQRVAYLNGFIAALEPDDEF